MRRLLETFLCVFLLVGALSATTPIPQSVVASSSGLASTFNFTIYDSSGTNDLNTMFVQLMGPGGISTSGACEIYAYPAGPGYAPAMYLMNDTFTAWLGPIYFASQQTVSNSWCTLYGAASIEYNSDAYHATLQLAVSFAPGKYSTTLPIKLSASGKSPYGQSPYTTLGYFTPTPVPAAIVSPAAGAKLGDPVTFQMTNPSWVPTPVYVSVGYSGAGSTDVWSSNPINGTTFTQSGLAPDLLHPYLYVRTMYNGSVADYTYTNPDAVVQSSMTSALYSTAPAPTDDYNPTGPAGDLTSISQYLTVHTSKGAVKIKRAGLINIGQLKYRHTQANDQYTYTYNFDNTQVEMVRLGGGGAVDLFAGPGKQADGTQPSGWMFLLSGWTSWDKPARSNDAEYTVTSPYKPGLMPMFFQGDIGPIPHMLKGSDNRAIAEAANIFDNSHVRFVIGPAISPTATQADVMAIVRTWATDYRFEFLKPLIDGGSLDGLEPSNELERDIVVALKDVL